MSASSGSNKLFWGAVLIVIGVLMLTKSFHLFDLVGFFIRNWPVVLILLGAYLIYEAKSKGAAAGDDQELAYQPIKSVSGGLLQSNVIGDVRLKLEQPAFNGGEAKTGVGSIIVDASQIKLAPGEQQLYLHCVVGDIQVDLAPNVPVQISTRVSLGDIKVLDRKADGFGQEINYKTPEYDAAPAKLNLICHVGMGDIRIF